MPNPDTTASSTPPTQSEPSPRLQEVLDRHARPDTRRAVQQLVNSVLPCLALWVLMFFTVQVSYPLTLAIALLTSGFLVRIFIIFHDCGHGSFLPSRRANQLVGFFAGVLTLTPHRRWWTDHLYHHATTGNLDRRGVGDVWTLTVSQYEASSPLRRWWYRCYRHPIFLFLVGPFYIFAFANRWPSINSRRHEVWSVLWTNLCWILIWVVLGLTVGLKTYLMIHIPVVLFSGMAGLWLFYVQHNFEQAYWKSDVEHDYHAACLVGSSHYELPAVLQWFSGNIGFHHIHHLNPRIPNYSLESCHRQLPDLPGVVRLTLKSSLRSLSVRLWCEREQRMITLGELATRTA